MRVYCVGGAVRDELLGLPVRDRDWVVVGATPAVLEGRGFQPVGRDFPVFLHPETREEYALARTERKSGRGYRGFVVHFSPDVTLEDDLRRRDLTINAMARDADGTLIDPWNGLRDLRDRVLRHVSEAFGEDPVRILRVARFAARFHDFSIAAETRALMRAMVEHGEADHLVPERVWQELSRGLMETHPSRMIAVLRECGALDRIAPELDAVWNDAMAGTLDAAAEAGAPLPVRFAVLLHGVAAGVDPGHPGQRRDAGARADAIAERLRAPTDCRDLARLVAGELPVLELAGVLDVEGLVRLVERIDGLRRPERMEQVLQACEIVHANPALDRVRLAADAMRALDAGAIAKAGPPATIRDRLHAARVDAVEQALLRAGEPAPSRAATAGSSTSAGSTSAGRTD
ncbi:multifunctional CCA addition/repair protein [Burkholderiaceae bacterium FT117]|uniref:multifunctional CCA addition/repair protein n=1 Tax=Zeimonas sediminis TaxID=2944268 RepID=UPI0023432176|nr:multifunctional CCA addition/repair protein [Zeimonas sediminis]MCM5571642.1 multifunctional CCA addition/repair protein [Zeimonas sediminis]